MNGIIEKIIEIIVLLLSCIEISRFLNRILGINSSVSNCVLWAVEARYINFPWDVSLGAYTSNAKTNVS